MKSYALHISYFAILLALLAFSFATNNHALAVFFGSAAAFATDPLLLLGSFLIGVLSKNLRIVLPVAIVFGIVASIYIANLNDALGAQLRLSTTVMRTITIIGLALIANAVRIAASGSSNDSSGNQ